MSRVEHHPFHAALDLYIMTYYIHTDTFLGTIHPKEETMAWLNDDDLVSAGTTYCEFKTDNAFNTFKDIVIALVRRPASFFRHMPVDGGFLNPTLFLILCTVACGFLSTILRASLWPLVRIPVLGVLSIYLTSGILHQISSRLFGGRGSFEATFRAAAYSGMVFLVMWISVLDVFAFFYGLFLLVLGTERVHGTDRSASIAAVVMSAAASLILLLIFGFWRWSVGLPF